MWACGLQVQATGLANTPLADPVRHGRALRFPRDHGAHLGARIEWWYATGWLGTQQAPTHGFQLTFFRSATGLAAQVQSRFAARQLLFAHAALTSLPGGGDTNAGSHQHEQRLQRWSGDPRAALARASEGDAAVVLGDWFLRRDGLNWHAELRASNFKLNLKLARTQEPLLQGEAGYSRKGPGTGRSNPYASHYYSEPQLAARVGLQPGNTTQILSATGRAWLDHEWSDQLLHPQAVGWDWVGFNFFDGSALTAFVLRRADGSALWAGGSFRSPAGRLQTFAPEQLKLRPQQRWRSPTSGANYPVQWQLDCPAGAFEVRALMAAQELDGSTSTGAVYWEGLSELTDRSGRRLALGYLEMTGYAGRLRLP